MVKKVKKKEMFLNYMRIAIEVAKKHKCEEIPVGCVIVNDETGEILAKSCNKTKKLCNPLMHAEIICINKALKKIHKDRLSDCSMYVTMEPCGMCVGAIALAKIKKLYIGCLNQKTGATISNRCQFDIHNHKPQIFYPVMEEECGKIVLDFFKKKR